MAVVQIKNFKKYFGKKLVHKDVNIDLQKGECLGLLGGSGAGKSVILRSLIGLEKPDSGEVHIGDSEISQWEEHQLIDIRKKVAYVFQGGALFDSMTVFDNIAYPLREHTQLSEDEIFIKVRDLLSDFGLSGNEHIFPSELSGGMQKRVGLMRSIILDPEIVLYDEPTAGLDPFNTKKIQEVILRLKDRGVSSVLVTHDMPSAMAVCDRIALLLDGRIATITHRKDMDKNFTGDLHRFVNGEFV